MSFSSTIKHGTFRILSFWMDRAPMMRSNCAFGETRKRISRKTLVLFWWYQVRYTAPNGMCSSPVMPVPPLCSSLVNLRKLDSGYPRVSTKFRDTMFPCMLPVSMVHLAIFVSVGFCSSIDFETIYTGRIHGDGHPEDVLRGYAFPSLAVFDD
jgi:hypothetical protein